MTVVTVTADAPPYAVSITSLRMMASSIGKLPMTLGNTMTLSGWPWHAQPQTNKVLSYRELDSRTPAICDNGTKVTAADPDRFRMRMIARWSFWLKVSFKHQV